MSLDVGVPVLAGGLWMAPKRRADRADASAKKPRVDDHGARVARLASATHAGVATVVPADQRVDKDYLDATGFRQPLIVRSPAQLDLVVPPQGAMTLADLETAIGSGHAVRAIDVASQRELASEMTLKEWMQYFGQAPDQRDRVLNLISLECSRTKLDALVRPPKVVREIGWVEKHWPAANVKNATARKEHVLKPKVGLYCLMSAAGSYTEFHVDFGGSSVWYHLYKGRKFFYVIPPTDVNLDRFAKWESEYQHGKAPFFGDLVLPGECTVLEMRAGDTMMLPSGWIHAVYTPEDSISFGGNFLSGYHMATHLRCHAKEKRQQIEGRFFFPEFECAVWYAAAHYAKMLSTCPSVLSKWEWQGLRVLLDGLKDWLAGKAHGLASTPDPDTLTRVKWICKNAVHCDPSTMLEKMATIVEAHIVNDPTPCDVHYEVEEVANADIVTPFGIVTQGAPVADYHPQQVRAEETEGSNRHVLEVQVSAMEDPRDAISRIATDDSSSSSSSSGESSSDSSDSSSMASSDGEDTGKESDQEPPTAGDDDNGDTNESSSDSSSDDDSSSSSSSSDNEEEPQKEPEDDKEPLKDEVEEFDEPEESSSSDSDNDFDPESSYPDLPPVPVDALIAIRKRAKLKELQITKQGKEQVIALARQHIIERQRSARSKKKKSASNSGTAVTVVTPWGEDEHWVVSCSCGLGGQDYDDGREMVECNNCKNWVHIDCVRVPVHDIFWCFKCRASDEWLFVCKCGVQEKNFDDGVRMVQCEVCEAWEHTRCGGVNDSEEPPEVYECTRCRKVRKKARPSSASQKKAKKNSKSKSGRGVSSAKQKTELSGITASQIPPAPAVPPLPSPPTGTSSPPPPPPPPPSAPPSPSSLPDEEYVPSVAKPTLQPDVTPSPVQKRKRGRPPLGKSKGKKVKQHDEDYRDSVDGLDSPAAVNSASVIMRPPLPITAKSATAPTKRKSGGSARDRLEKKLKTRKPRS